MSVNYAPISVEYKDHMGSDLSVVNAARVSFAKEHDEFDEDKDTKLINFLAKHVHWSPFAHTAVTLKVKAPIFVARQLVKHQIGLTWNEESRRYIEMDVEPEFYMPKSWRGKAKNKKQGSDETVIIDKIDVSHGYVQDTNNAVRTAVKHCLILYENMLASGVAPEQARMVLPQNMMVNWFWTGNLVSFARVCNLRIKSDAQAETREVALGIFNVMKDLYPISWKAMLKHVESNENS